MKVKRMGITEILRRIWLFSANKIKSSESFSKQPTQLIVELNSSLWHIIVTLDALYQTCEIVTLKTNLIMIEYTVGPIDKCTITYCNTVSVGLSEKKFKLT